MRVAILGCGPAGLMAAHAVSLQGHDPIIYSKKEPSKMFGAMYLHKPIYGINSPRPDFMMNVIKVGSAEEYAKKVYGDPKHPVSFDHYETGEVQAWDLGETYELLWSIYEHKIRDVELSFGDITTICDYYGIVLSTIPAPILCTSGCKFENKAIWVLHGIDAERPLFGDDYMMYYAGDPSIPWYRYSQIRKYQSWEYGFDPGALPLRVPPFTLSLGTKPLDNDCRCPRSNLHRLGRFGKWKKGELTHHAFEESTKIVREEIHALL